MNVGPIDSAAAYVPVAPARAPEDVWRTHDQKVPPNPDVKRTEMRVESGPGLAWVYTLIDATTGAELWRWPIESPGVAAEAQPDAFGAGHILDVAA